MYQTDEPFKLGISLVLPQEINNNTNPNEAPRIDEISSGLLQEPSKIAQMGESIYLMPVSD